MGLCEGSTRGEWKLTFGSDLRNKNSVFQEHSYRGEEVCFPQIAEQRLIIPHFFCTSVAAVREISSMHEQKLRAALFESPTQLSDWTFSSDGCSALAIFLLFFFLSLSPQWSCLNWAEWGWGEGGERTALCKEKKKITCVKCEVCAQQSANNLRPLGHSPRHLGA